MTFKPYLADLKKKGVTYLANVTPSKRLKTVLAIADNYFDKECFVPGFPDLFVFTDNIEKIKRMEKQYNAFTVRFFSANRFRTTNKIIHPDLIYVDSNFGLAKIKKLYPKVPMILNVKESKNGMCILVDSREQLPLFKGDQFKKSTLYVGDYTTEKLNDKFFIERKSPMDLYGTLTKGHRRFRDEILRAQFNNMHLVLLVECPRKTFVEKKFNGAARLQLTPTHIEKITRTTIERYGVEVVWCRNREHAKRYTINRLKLEESKL